MRKIAVNNKLALIDDEDFDVVSSHNWTLREGRNTWYAQCSIKIKGSPKIIKSMHTLIMGGDNMVDHIDGDGLNNQKNNLRICSRSQNGANRVSAKNSTSKYLGVSYHKPSNSWQSHIRKNGKQYYIGCFKSEEDAAIAYNDQAIKEHGEFARLNQI